MKGQVAIAFLALIVLFLALFLLGGASNSFNLIYLDSASNMTDWTRSVMELLPAACAILLAIVFFINLKGV